MRVAITREVSPAIARCELTHLPRKPIDLELARAQHARYETHLSELGCRVERLPGAIDLPDSVFVEDAAVVLPEVAFVARSGAPSRRPEAVPVALTLSRYREIVRIDAPATLDGGDVLHVGRTIHVGLSRRTNAAAVEQLRAALTPLGYRVVPLPVADCLHLKSAVTLVGERTILVQPRWIDVRAFPDLERIEIAPEEPFAANALLLGRAVLHATAFPLTRRRLEARGIEVVSIDVSELAKAEGGVTCCSLILDA